MKSKLLWDRADAKNTVKHKEKHYFWKPVLANEREARSSMNPSLQVSQKAKKETLRVFACLRVLECVDVICVFCYVPARAFLCLCASTCVVCAVSLYCLFLCASFVRLCVHVFISVYDCVSVCAFLCMWCEALSSR